MEKFPYVITGLLSCFICTTAPAQTAPSPPSKHDQACAAIGWALQQKMVVMEQSILANTSNMSAMEPNSESWKAAEAINATQNRMVKNLANVALEVKNRFGGANTDPEKEFAGRLADAPLMQVVDLAGKCINSGLQPADPAKTVARQSG
jgi:hypothetical protein